MSPDVTGAIIAVASVLSSWIGAAYIAGRKDGRTEVRLTMLENNQGNLATKEQLAGVKEDLAEIKGMFRMTLRTDTTDGPHRSDI